MSVTPYWARWPFMRCGKNWNQVATVAILVSTNADEVITAAMAASNGIGSGGRFCVCDFGRNLAAVAVKTFSRLIYFRTRFYKFCTPNAICKTMLQQIVLLLNKRASARAHTRTHKGSSPSSLTRSYATLSVLYYPYIIITFAIIHTLRLFSLSSGLRNMNERITRSVRWALTIFSFLERICFLLGSHRADSHFRCQHFGWTYCLLFRGRRGDARKKFP
jgi:hypothetical protein